MAGKYRHLKWLSVAVALYPLTIPTVSKAADPAPLPAASIQPPDADVPTHIAAFCGVWEGRWKGQLHHILIVEEVGRDSATVIYAWGTHDQWQPKKPGWSRTRATIEDDELFIDWGDTTVRYDLDDDGELNGTYRRSRSAAGITMHHVSDDGCAWETTSKAKSTTWPASQSSFVPGVSESPVKAKLPDDVRLIAPSADLPEEIAAYAGSWSGWMCNRACDTKLAVEKVTEVGATIVYAFGSTSVGTYTERISAKFVDGELRGVLGGGQRLSYRLRGDGHLDVKWTDENGSDWISGILARD